MKVRFNNVVQRRNPTLTEDMRLYHMRRRALEQSYRKALSRERWRVWTDRYWAALHRLHDYMRG